MNRFLPVIFLLLFLVFISPVKGEVIQASPDHEGNSIWLRGPANNSSLFVNTTALFTVYSESNSSVKLEGFGSVRDIQTRALADFTFKVLGDTPTLRVIANGTTILQLTFTVIEPQPYVPPVSPEQPVEETPGAWLWSPLIVGALVLLTTMAGCGLGFGLTRLTKLVHFISPISIAALALGFLAFVANSIYLGFADGSTIVNFAFWSSRNIIIFGIGAGILLGIVGGRFSLKRHKFWFVDQENKRISETEGVVYEIDNRKNWADQSWRRAWQRLRGKHFEIVKMHDLGDVREGWVIEDEMDSATFQPVSKMEYDEERRVLRIDATSAIKNPFFVSKQITEKKEGQEKTTTVKVLAHRRRDFSNFSHLFDCNAIITDSAAWKTHCTTLEKLREAYYEQSEENLELTQELYSIRNRDFMAHLKLLDDTLLGLIFKKKDPKEFADEDAEIKASLESRKFSQQVPEQPDIPLLPSPAQPELPVAVDAMLEPVDSTTERSTGQLAVRKHTVKKGGARND